MSRKIALAIYFLSHMIDHTSFNQGKSMYSSLPLLCDILVSIYDKMLPQRPERPFSHSHSHIQCNTLKAPTFLYQLQG